MLLCGLASMFGYEDPIRKSYTTLIRPACLVWIQGMDSKESRRNEICRVWANNPKKNEFVRPCYVFLDTGEWIKRHRQKNRGNSFQLYSITSSNKKQRLTWARGTLGGNSTRLLKRLSRKTRFWCMTIRFRVDRVYGGKPG